MDGLLLAHPTLGKITTPAYVLDEAALLRNLRILRGIADASGCKILLAQKAFSMFAVYPMISGYLSGTTASGLYEAKLGREEFGGEVHVFCPAYLDNEFGDIAEVSDHIVFNSFAQLRKFRSRSKGKSLGIRINPECSTQDEPIYDPCAPNSRLGVTIANFDEAEFEGVDGIHFHTLCEQGFGPLEKTVRAVEDKFGKYLHQCKWVNFGGGHHITKPGYDTDGLIKLIRRFSEEYGVQVYLEPGEAVVLNAGWLVTEVLETVRNGMTRRRRATCPMCWKCRTVRRFSQADSPVKRNTHTAFPRAHALPGTSSETTASTSRFTRATGCALRIWRFIQW